MKKLRWFNLVAGTVVVPLSAACLWVSWGGEAMYGWIAATCAAFNACMSEWQLYFKEVDGE